MRTMRRYSNKNKIKAKVSSQSYVSAARDFSHTLLDDKGLAHDIRNFVDFIIVGARNFGGGTLFVLDKGILWRSMTTTMEKFISYGSMIMHSVTEDTALNGKSCLYIKTDGPIEEVTLDKNGRKPDETRVLESWKLIEKFDASYMAKDYFDAISEIEKNPHNIVDVENVGVTILIVPECHPHAVEMDWAIYKCMEEYAEMQRKKDLPTFEQMHPPGQFDDVDAEPMSEEEYKKAYAEYEERIKKYGELEVEETSPDDLINMWLKMKGLHEREFCPWHKPLWFRKKNCTRFDKMRKVYNGLEANHWMRPKPLNMKDVVEGQFDDAPEVEEKGYLALLF